MESERADDPASAAGATAARQTPQLPRGRAAPRSQGDRPAAHVVQVLGVCRPVVVTGSPAERAIQLAEAQRGVVSRAQLTAAGLDGSRIARMVRARHLHRLHRGVYRVGPALGLPWAAEAAALLACGDGVLLSHRSAAALWGLPVMPGAGVEVSVAGRHCAEPTGVTVHRTRTLIPADVRVHERLPVTAVPRLLVDLAGAVSLRELERVLDEAFVRRLATHRQLSAALGRAHGRQGAALLAGLLEREAAGTMTRSQAEERFLTLVREAQLPPPRVNVRVHGYEVDFLWPAHRVAVEIDGYQFHGTRSAFERDRRKAVVLAAAGIVVMRGTWRQLEHEAVALITSVAQTLVRAEAARTRPGA